MNIAITYDNLVAHLEPDLPQDMLISLSQQLRYHKDGYQYVYNYKSGRSDGWTYLLQPNQCFRRGLLNRVVKFLTKNGHTVTTQYIGKEPPLLIHSLNSNLIRPYTFQQEMAQAAYDNQIGILVSPTGTGKTITLALSVDKLKRKTFIFVTDIVLMDQMHQSMQRLFEEPIGMIGDGEFDLQDITVSTIQSLLSIQKAKTLGAADKRIKLVKHLETIGLVAFDEVHQSDIDTMDIIIPLFKNADRFIGLSATPAGWAEKSEKKDNFGVEQHFGSVIYDARKNDFIELGLKVPIYVQTIEREPINKIYNKYSKYNRFTHKEELDLTKCYKDALDTELLNNSQYHEDVAKYAIGLMDKGNSVFVHATHSIEFGKLIQERIPGSVLINGSTPRLERRNAYDAVRKKELLCIVSDIGGTGLDLPNLNAFILASDIVDIRQLVGRVSRKAEGKDFGLVVDFYTNCSFLRKHYETRLAQYKHENYLVL